MQSSSATFSDPSQLREQAERKARSIPQPDFSSMTPQEIQQKFYELHAKQIQAELQNEQLRSQREERDDQAELLSTVTENMLDIVSLTDMEGNICFANKAHESLGYETEFLVGKNVMDFVHPEDLPYVRHSYQKLFTSPNFHRISFRYRCCEGSYLWLETRAVFLRDKQENPQKIIFSSRDITARKQAEEALRESENKFYRLIEETPVSIMHFDKNGIVKFVNKWHIDVFAKGMLGRDFFINKKITDLPGIQSAGIGPELEKILKGETVVLDQVHIPKFAAGHEGYQCMRGVPFFCNGEISGGILIREDITECKQTEKNLCYQKQLLETIINGTWDVLAIQYPDHTIERYNKAGYELLGLPPDKVDGRKCFELIGRDRECSPCATQQALQCKEPVNIEKYVPELGKHLDCRSSPVLDESGDIIRIVEHLRDITERKQAEKEKEKLQVQLRQSQKMEAIGTLAGGIAHDFNNILSSVLGYTELSMEEVEKDTLLHQNLSQVFAAGNRAKDLVKQILAFGRNMEQVFIHTPIEPLVKEALKMLRSTFPSSIEIRESINIEQGVVYADPTQLHQVIVNLATNAKQAMSDKGGLLEVSVETASFDENIQEKYPDIPPGNYVRLSVSDTGCGISEKYLDKIFEPYFTTSETGTGSGLGLSVVHSIVKTHNGHITVYSESGKGTTFHVYLPLAEQERSRVASPVQEYEALQTGTENILIVDDEKPIVEMQQQILEGLGYKVTSRTSSAEALESFRSDPNEFDIVITDMTMPNMTGDRLALKIKKIRPDVPVILCTGFSEKINQQKNGDPGVEGCMMKPVTRTELAKTVRTILDKFIHPGL
ncbi:MAG: PAS domain-containing hybrid sensor histidine kinase/response regulator [Bacteroidota bacterium]